MHAVVVPVTPCVRGSNVGVGLWIDKEPDILGGKSQALRGLGNAFIGDMTSICPGEEKIWRMSACLDFGECRGCYLPDVKPGTKTCVVPSPESVTTLLI